MSGFEDLDEGEKERLRDWAAGFVGEVRKASEEAPVVVDGERIALSWDIRAVLRVRVERRAWLSLRVSWSLRRRRRMDSGVGAVVETGSWRFYERMVS